MFKIVRFGVLAALMAGVMALAPLGPAGAAPASCASWQAPVAAPVIDAFRPPPHIGAPGNRGWEYRTSRGTSVQAAGPGQVVFAGVIAGERYVSIDHPCGLRTTYSHLASIGVERGQVVEGGVSIGTAGERLHFGVRRGRQYLDPASLFHGVSAPVVQHPRLVPVTLGPH